MPIFLSHNLPPLFFSISRKEEWNPTQSTKTQKSFSWFSIVWMHKYLFELLISQLRNETNFKSMILNEEWFHREEARLKLSQTSIHTIRSKAINPSVRYLAFWRTLFNGEQNYWRSSELPSELPSPLRLSDKGWFHIQQKFLYGISQKATTLDLFQQLYVFKKWNPVLSINSSPWRNSIRSNCEPKTTTTNTKTIGKLPSSQAL